MGEAERWTDDAGLAAAAPGRAEALPGELWPPALLEHLREGLARGQVLLGPRGEPEDLHLLTVNPAFERLLAAPAAAGRRLSAAAPGFCAPGAPLLRALAQVARTGVPTRLIHEEAGRRRWFAVTLYRPRAGEVVAIFEDVTAAHEAEAARARLEAELRQSQKLETLGRLAAGIAHDVNNLLAVILSCAGGAAESLRAGQPGALEDLEEALRSGARAKDLTRRLLSFMRKHEEAPGPLDPAAVVRGVESLLRRLLGADVALAVALAPDLWPVRLGAGLLEQVLLNLALNARDAMPAGGRLEVRGENARHEGRDWVRLEVRDNGTGMSPEVQARAFEAFFTTKAGEAGTGLGLAVAHDIVAEAGGRIRIESARGAGACLELLLPRHLEPAPA